MRTGPRPCIDALTMSRIWLIAPYALSFLTLTWASPFLSPSVTPAAYGAIQPRIADPTPVPDTKESYFNYGEWPYDAMDSANSAIEFPSSSFARIATTTSWVPKSVCGYVNGDWRDCTCARSTFIVEILASPNTLTSPVNLLQGKRAMCLPHLR